MLIDRQLRTLIPFAARGPCPADTVPPSPLLAARTEPHKSANRRDFGASPETSVAGLSLFLHAWDREGACSCCSRRWPPGVRVGYRRQSSQYFGGVLLRVGVVPGVNPLGHAGAVMPKCAGDRFEIDEGLSELFARNVCEPQIVRGRGTLPSRKNASYTEQVSRTGSSSRT